MAKDRLGKPRLLSPFLLAARSKQSGFVKEKSLSFYLFRR